MSLIGEVYMIRHNVTGRMYIGRTKDVQGRIKQHLYFLRRGKHRVEDMQEDYDKYGENYSVTILGRTDTRLTLETEMMDKYRSTTRGIGYNYKDPHVTTKIRNTERANRRQRTHKEELIRYILSLDDAQAENVLKRLPDIQLLVEGVDE